MKVKSAPLGIGLFQNHFHLVRSCAGAWERANIKAITVNNKKNTIEPVYKLNVLFSILQFRRRT